MDNIEDWKQFSYLMYLSIKKSYSLALSPSIITLIQMIWSAIKCLLVWLLVMLMAGVPRRIRIPKQHSSQVRQDPTASLITHTYLAIFTQAPIFHSMSFMDRRITTP